MAVCGLGDNDFKEGALVLMQSKLSQIIKQIALDAVQSNKPLEIVKGTVISNQPLKINLSQFVDIDTESIIIPLDYVEHEEEITIKEQTINLTDENQETKQYTINEQTIKIKKKAQLKDNDKIIMLKFNKGQKFFLLGLQQPELEVETQIE